MKTKILLATLFTASALVYSQPDSPDHPGQRQPDPHKLIEKIHRLDSVIYLLRDVQTGADIEDYVFVNSYDKGKVDPREVVKLDLPGRARLNLQLYTYSSDGFRTRYLYQEWIGGGWTDRMSVDYSPDDGGRLGRELFSTAGSDGSWNPYQQHLYSYDYLGRIALYLRRMSDNNGGWYDFSENIWSYNDRNQLLQRVEQRVADDYVIWTETYNYSDGTRPVERIRQTMRYDPVLRYNTLVNDSRHLYFYDEFNDPVVTEQYKWVNGTWVFVGKSLYYYSFIPGRKIAICHNGQTIFVEPKEIKAHLAHGDRIGPCNDNSDGENRQSDTFITEAVRYAKVFPNPASDYFELELIKGHSFKSAYLISSAGRIVKSQDINSLERAIFEVRGLVAGLYILKLYGDTTSEDIPVIIK